MVLAGNLDKNESGLYSEQEQQQEQQKESKTR